MQYDEIIATISDVLESLYKSDVIKSRIACTEGTILIGENAELDSLAFVTFISDLEERISLKAGTDIFFDLDQIADFNVSNPFISVKDFALFVLGLVGE